MENDVAAGDDDDEGTSIMESVDCMPMLVWPKYGIDLIFVPVKEIAQTFLPPVITTTI